MEEIRLLGKISPQKALAKQAASKGLEFEPCE